MGVVKKFLTKKDAEAFARKLKKTKNKDWYINVYPASRPVYVVNYGRI